MSAQTEIAARTAALEGILSDCNTELVGKGVSGAATLSDVAAQIAGIKNLRVETGSFTLAAHETSSGDTVTIPCSEGAKVVVVTSGAAPSTSVASGIFGCIYRDIVALGYLPQCTHVPEVNATVYNGTTMGNAARYGTYYQNGLVLPITSAHWLLGEAYTWTAYYWDTEGD